jgi:hypothetical protein
VAPVEQIRNELVAVVRRREPEEFLVDSVGVPPAPVAVVVPRRVVVALVGEVAV